MLRYYVRIAWRMMKKHRAYSFINVLGLAIGICACVVIYLITSHEFSFDRFHTDENRIYRITGEVQRLNGGKEFANSPVPDVAGIEHDIPGFEAKAGVHFYDASVTVPGNGDSEKFNSDQVIVTEPGYFKIFRYRWLAGNEKTALQQAHTVVISEKQARKYFGNGLQLKNMIGRTLVYNDSLPLTVTGIVEDWRAKTDFPYTDFISISTASDPFLKKEIPSMDWTSLRPHAAMAFVKLDKNVTREGINLLLKKYLVQHAKADFFGKLVKLELQPLSDIHFTDEFYRADDGDGFRKAHKPTLYALMAIAIFILALAVVNFVNLSTALSFQRAKEIGVRKVMGSERKGLVIQLLTETFVLACFAAVLSALLVNPVISLFSSYIPKGISFHLFDAGTLFFFGALTLATSLLAGFYPARVLSSLAPVWSLKGTLNEGAGSKAGLRKALIVFQFTVSLIFIVGTMVIKRQINYMRTADKGFKTDAVITVNNWGDASGKMKVLVENTKKIAGVENAILQEDAPMGFAERAALLQYKGKKEGSVEVIVRSGNDKFIPFYKMKIVAGRNLLPGDSTKELIINEACARSMGYKDPREAVGKFLSGNNRQVPIVGVVANFHTGSFHDPIRPLVIQHFPEFESSMAISLSSAGKNISETRKIISQVEQEWKNLYPGKDFRFNFLDDSIGWLFEKDEQTAWLTNAAMIITIFISCMGLFGLAMYTAERRTKEIGIRKVLGASVSDIAIMLSKDFGKLIVLSALIASPVAWLLMNQWLRDFAYRTNITWWIFAIAMLLALLVALITVSYQSVKAALANPVTNLRTE